MFYLCLGQQSASGVLGKAEEAAEYNIDLVSTVSFMKLTFTWSMTLKLSP